ncbi:MAG: RtcB family protein [Planctomicrobium sp.]|jgi:tRNA-splicing ligase RtcB (3'-phosphate/5'-hydroxy nucleic acid ligase)|nr:RtcB family protein [Planctomicrobium sp.]
MNRKQLAKIGVPDYCTDEAIQAIQAAVNAGARGKDAKQQLIAVLAEPENYLSDEIFGTFAKSMFEDETAEPITPIDYAVWGDEYIEEMSHQQMREACSLPHAVAGALMPDAHIGYGLPIGGVLALEGAICPYAVGVDIACRMKLSVLDLPLEVLSNEKRRRELSTSLEKGTVFGTGKAWSPKQNHAVLDQDWSVSKITRQNKDKAWKQLGTSGSGNHFVEFGLLTVTEDDKEMNLKPGEYVALLSHSGSRGTGHSVCSTYSAIARKSLPKKYAHYGRLAWLEMDSEAGQEYWAAMNLMGDYASANHAVIHRNVIKLAGANVIGGVENHHNFAWKETHGGREVIVHRKGATPAGAGVLGVIPGSMATPAYVVRGKGNDASLHSASHGAGRVMSRKKAKSMFRLNAVRNDLKKKGIEILSAGSDEVPMVYKDIEDVMNAQTDLVEKIARFDPKVVKMCGDGSRAED